MGWQYPTYKSNIPKKLNYCLPFLKAGFISYVLSLSGDINIHQLSKAKSLGVSLDVPLSLSPISHQ